MWVNFDARLRAYISGAPRVCLILVKQNLANKCAALKALTYGAVVHALNRFHRALSRVGRFLDRFPQHTIYVCKA